MESPKTVSMEIDPEAGNDTEYEETKLLSGYKGQEYVKPVHFFRLLKEKLHWSVYNVFIHSVILILCLYLLFSESSQKDETRPLTGRSWSPIQSSIKYKIGTEHSTHGHDTAFNGPPSVGNDAAWTYLLEPLAFNATFEELQKAGEATDADLIEFQGGGYAASIAVYHELHCLMRMRQWLYKEHYYRPDLTQHNIDYLRGHLDHCIDVLRLSVMCHGNTEMMSHSWSSAEQKTSVDNTNGKSVCVDWDSVDEWGRSRMASEKDILRTAFDDYLR